MRLLCQDHKSFVIVLCTHVLEHVPDLDGALSDLRRIARRRPILVVPRERGARYPLDLHVHFFPSRHSFLNRIAAPEDRFVCELLQGDLHYREDCAWAAERPFAGRQRALPSVSPGSTA